MKRLPLSYAVASLLGSGLALAQESIELADLAIGGDGFVIDGINAGDRIGNSVSAVGDLNGDGFDDIVVGAPNAISGGASFAGQSYVVFGTDQGFPNPLALTTLNGSNGFFISGAAAYDRIGGSVSGAGDINSDGLNDIIIGAAYAGSGGETYVVFGTDLEYPNGLNLATLNGTNGITIDGANTDDRSGRSVSAAGDVNGDDQDDVIIGADRADPGGVDRAGESYVVFGTDQGFPNPLDLATTNGNNGFAINGIGSSDASGSSVSSAGDVNGDGLGDIIVGANFAASDGIDQAGESYVVFGSDEGFPTSLDLATLDGRNGFAVKGIDAQDRSGFSVSAAGDLNGDGLNDVIVGTFGADPGGVDRAGESYVVFGSGQGFPSSLDLATLDGSNGFVINGIDAEDGSGRSVSAAGDVNGDGMDDIIIGASYADPSAVDRAGESYVVFGRDQNFPNPLSLANLNGINGFVINGIEEADFVGSSVSAAGDVNGDGLDDVMVGAPGVASAGAIYVVFGNAPPQAMGNEALLVDVLEDEMAPAGTRLDSIVANSYLDEDAFAGAAVINDQSSFSEGRWQYSSDGFTWIDLPQALSDVNALVLGAESLLRFLPAINFSGQPGSLSMRLWDGRWRQQGAGVDITNAVGAFGGFSNDSNQLNVTLDITPVNDAPRFVASDPPPVALGSEARSVSNWASVDPGAPDEANQTVTLAVTEMEDVAFFAVAPAVDVSGNLTYTLAPGVQDSSTFSVVATDNGGTANGGIDESAPQTFVIVVQPDLLFADSFE